MMERLRLVTLLRAENIPAEILPKKNPKINVQLQYALEKYIPLAIIFGGEEFKNRVVKVKDLSARTEEAISIDELLPYIKQRLQ